MWDAEEVSCVVTVALTFLSVVSASVLGSAVCGADGVMLGGREMATEAEVGTDAPGVEALRLAVVALGEMLVAVVVGGSDAGVEVVIGELTVRLLTLSVVPPSGIAVGALVGILVEVGTVVGGSVRMRSTKENP